jgi:hypothetical protein
VADVDPDWKRIAQLTRMLGSRGRERRNAFAALERFMHSHGISWSDLGNAIERNTDGKYTEDEMQQFALAVRKEGIEEGIKIGIVRGQAQQHSNGHIVLPEASEMAEYCHQRPSRLNDRERNFISEVYERTRRRTNLPRGTLGYLASVYIKHGGSISC